MASTALSSAAPARHDDHELIIHALRERDQAGARRAMEEHIVGTVTIITTEARATH
ncbi:MAG TPA: FCD domain-containing protein [Streptosporangiaceae bacterium]|nr:FCD domain-containing protein [Streptosporangiaceae bacterium]